LVIIVILNFQNYFVNYVVNFWLQAFVFYGIACCVTHFIVLNLRGCVAIADCRFAHNGTSVRRNGSIIFILQLGT